MLFLQSHSLKNSTQTSWHQYWRMCSTNFILSPQSNEMYFTDLPLFRECVYAIYTSWWVQYIVLLWYNSLVQTLTFSIYYKRHMNAWIWNCVYLTVRFPMITSAMLGVSSTHGWNTYSSFVTQRTLSYAEYVQILNTRGSMIRTSCNILLIMVYTGISYHRLIDAGCTLK